MAMLLQQPRTTKLQRDFHCDPSAKAPPKMKQSIGTENLHVKVGSLYDKMIRISFDPMLEKRFESLRPKSCEEVPKGGS